jgi:membrane protein YqaA with SNARE-associated domain
MHKLVLWVKDVLVPFLGPPGVFVAALLDSSFLSLPEINDLLVVSSAAAHPGGAWVFVLMATGGSLAGCAILWWLGRRGGEALLHRRFERDHVERARGAFERWDVLALAIPSVLPPPMPFKIFVLGAGVFGVPFPRFLATLALARGLRYTVWAWAGASYGPAAIEALRAVDGWVAARLPWLAALAVLALAAWLGARIRRREAARDDSAIMLRK